MRQQPAYHEQQKGKEARGGWTFERQVDVLGRELEPIDVKVASQILAFQVKIVSCVDDKSATYWHACVGIGCPHFHSKLVGIEWILTCFVNVKKMARNELESGFWPKSLVRIESFARISTRSPIHLLG